METQCISPTYGNLLQVPHKPLSIETRRDLSFEEFCLTLSPLLSTKNSCTSVLESPKEVPDFWLETEIKSRGGVGLEGKDKPVCESVNCLSDSRPSLPLKRQRNRLTLGKKTQKSRKV